MTEIDGHDERYGGTMPPIVLVEDDPVARAIVAGYLERLNLCNPILTVGDGDEAVGLLSSHTTPSLVILDLELPGRSGLDVLEWIRADPRLSDVPVLMLTGTADLDLVDRAYELGITSYLVKPVGYSALQDILRGSDLPMAIVHSHAGR